MKLCDCKSTTQKNVAGTRIAQSDKVYVLPELQLPVCNECGSIAWDEKTFQQLKALLATLEPSTPKDGECPPKEIKAAKPLRDLKEDMKKGKAA